MGWSNAKSKTCSVIDCDNDADPRCHIHDEHGGWLPACDGHLELPCLAKYASDCKCGPLRGTWQQQAAKDRGKQWREDCSECCGRGGRWDDECQDQWYDCDACIGPDDLIAAAKYGAVNVDANGAPL